MKSLSPYKSNSGPVKMVSAKPIKRRGASDDSTPVFSKIHVRSFEGKSIHKPNVSKQKGTRKKLEFVNEKTVNKIICRHSMHLEPEKHILERLLSVSKLSTG